MLGFPSPVVRLVLGAAAGFSLAAAACTSFGTDDVPVSDASPPPPATGLVEASAPDAALVEASVPDAASPDATTRARKCNGASLAAFSTEPPPPTFRDLTAVGNPAFVPTPPFVGAPMVAVINPSMRSTVGLKGMAGATIPSTGRFCFEMWAQVTVPTADAGGEVVVLQVGLGGTDSIRIDFGATARFGGSTLAPFLRPTDEPHHWVVEVFPFAGRHKATLTIDGVLLGEFQSPTLVGNGNTFLAFGASTDSATQALVNGGKVVIGEAYATVQP